VTAPTRATPAGRAYLDLRRKARQDHRPVDELMQLYVLESFLARMAATRFADRFVLKGGVLLAAFGERRPTRDIDLQAQAFDNDPAAILAAITEIAAKNASPHTVASYRDGQLRAAAVACRSTRRRMASLLRGRPPGPAKTGSPGPPPRSAR
jgi:Nucleotidyl transferase AbiEii toxin, Type IV TA system